MTKEIFKGQITLYVTGEPRGRSSCFCRRRSCIGFWPHALGGSKGRVVGRDSDQGGGEGGGRGGDNNTNPKMWHFKNAKAQVVRGAPGATLVLVKRIIEQADSLAIARCKLS